MSRISIDYLFQEAENFLSKLLFDNKLRLGDIPQELRVVYPSNYVTAFRADGWFSSERYIEDLTILTEDILSLDDDFFYKKRLIKKLDGFLCRFNATEKIKGDELDEFRKNLPESILREMHRNRRITEDNIRAALEEQRRTDKMNIQIKQQDLMTVNKPYVLAHCISADCAMGAGIVVAFKKKYKGIKERCRVYVGEIGVDNTVGTAYRDVSENGIVYNLFSKRYVYQNAEKGMTTAEYHTQLRQSLTSMREQMLEHGEKFLAMPKIASGLDRCDWSDVEQIIIDVFEGTAIEILVCVL